MGHLAMESLRYTTGVDMEKRGLPGRPPRCPPAWQPRRGAAPAAAAEVAATVTGTGTGTLSVTGSPSVTQAPLWRRPPRRAGSATARVRG